jgi:hypothetical protein
MTTLEGTTKKILSAIESRDFEQLDRAVKERGALLASGAEVTPQAWELGSEACQALVSLKQNLIVESSRLEQVRKIGETLPADSPSHREYFG